MERLQVSKEWLQKYQEIKPMMSPGVNYADCFKMKEIGGKELFVLRLKK